MDIEQATYRQLYLNTLPLSELTALSEQLRGEVINLDARQMILLGICL